MQTGLNIPCHWNQNVMAEILDRTVPHEGLPVLETYGALPGSPFGHGRVDRLIPATSLDTAMAFRHFLRERHVALTYVLNAPHLPDGNRPAMDAYLSWLVRELQPDALIIASHELMRYVREKDPEIPIHVSTVAAVRTSRDLAKFLDIRPNRVVPHHDLGKDWVALDALMAFARAHRVDVELLVTESCLYSCPCRSAHYAHVANPANTSDLQFHVWCQSKKIARPSEFLRAGGATRPEDIHLLEERDVTVFKISGRSWPAVRIPRIVAAYQDRSYSGNLFELLGVSPAIRNGWVYLNSQALDGFLKDFPQGSIEAQKKYAEAVVIRLYDAGHFFVKGAEYETKNGALVLKSDQKGKDILAMQLV